MSDERKFCTFLLAGHFFGVEVERVQEVIRHQEMTRIPRAPVHVRGLINLRGQIVTALDLRKALGYPERTDGQLPMNVVVRTESGVVSLLVDEIDEVVEVTSETYEPPPGKLDGIAEQMIRGVYKFDGRLMLELDTEETMKAASMRVLAGVEG